MSLSLILFYSITIYFYVVFWLSFNCRLCCLYKLLKKKERRKD
jgi:hypothetical protein